MGDEITIRVSIAERYYPIKIDSNDEERIRLAAKRINDAVLQYKKVYSDKDTQDFLAMATLQFVSKLTQLEDNKTDNQLVEILEKLNYDLDIAIEKE
ncbi:MAG: cell division protein ZapA [Salinivirgaceae bacterium]|jgi:cell division protein ZapA (FtsZ GTPase activity inhibitor)|nr:cell division protein ZapA [Bacteroidales bacterium]HPW66644.1 cell division protein ZapA [Salinivirgaceae bacterium]HQA75996.1 cell division protein ZapA [Salinivirgaceae bacterium]